MDAPPLRSGSKNQQNDTLLVITGLVPVIPIIMALRFSDRDGRHKAGHDEEGVTPLVQRAADEGRGAMDAP